MTSHPRSPSPPPRRLFAVIAALGFALGMSPASAQYGGGVDLFVDPTRVEIDGTFDYFGSSCPSGGTVTISIDGVSGVLDTTTAFDDSSYAGSDVAMPPGIIAGQDYTVRASCGGGSDIAVIRAVCNGGTDPVDGACPDGNTVGGQDPTATTTTTTPGSGGTGGTGTGGTGTGGTGTGGTGTGGTGTGGTGTGGTGTGGTGNNGTGSTPGSNPTLAVTGASFAEQAAQIGITLVALGAILVLLTGRRRPRTSA